MFKTVARPEAPNTKASTHRIQTVSVGLGFSLCVLCFTVLRPEFLTLRVVLRAVSEDRLHEVRCRVGCSSSHGV